jgi:hypothetical protein
MRAADLSGEVPLGQLSGAGMSAEPSTAMTTSLARALTSCVPRGTFSRLEAPSMSSSQRAAESLNVSGLRPVKGYVMIHVLVSVK